MATSLDSLRRFEKPGIARFVQGQGGLPRLEISTRHATAHLYLNGAHVTHFQPTGSSALLFLSEKSFFAPGKAIRGGIPIIFPWFGAHAEKPELPAHGFARSTEWEMEGLDLWPDEICQVTLRLVSSDATLALWPYDFILRLRVTISRKLELALEVENWSGSPMLFEEALHTYLAVRDVRQTTVTGVQGCEYLDKADGFARKRQTAEPVHFEGETDRIYLQTSSVCTVDDAAAARRFLVTPSHSATTVLWNPGEAKAAKLVDLGTDEWPHFVCVETANASENRLTLPHGEAHVMGASIALE